jgi:hypothetical protein
MPQVAADQALQCSGRTSAQRHCLLERSQLFEPLVTAAGTMRWADFSAQSHAQHDLSSQHRNLDRPVWRDTNDPSAAIRIN